MEVDKTFIARAVAPKKIDPPAQCIKDKTIAMDTFKTRLLMFKDTRKEAQDYIATVLPTFLDTTTKPDDMIAFYKKMEHQWLEFDFGTNILSLCSLKKSKV